MRKIFLALLFSTIAFAKTELKPHPQAKDGLIRIEEDGTYIYKQPILPKSQSVSARLGILNKPNVQGNAGQNYADIYGSNQLYTLLVDYEWQFFKGFGILGAQAGGGFATAQGNGILSESHVAAEEKYNLFVFPTSGSLVYRFEFKSRQLVVPYVNAGVTYFGMVEKRNDSKPPQLAGALAVHQSGGIMVCVSCFDRVSSATLAEDYGISSMAVTAEVRAYEGLRQDINFTGLTYTGGIAVDF